MTSKPTEFAFEDEYCDCGKCAECDERAFDHLIDQQTQEQIERIRWGNYLRNRFMHGVDD